MRHRDKGEQVGLDNEKRPQHNIWSTLLWTKCPTFGKAFDPIATWFDNEYEMGALRIEMQFPVNNMKGMTCQAKIITR